MRFHSGLLAIFAALALSFASSAQAQIYLASWEGHEYNVAHQQQITFEYNSLTKILSGEILVAWKTGSEPVAAKIIITHGNYPSSSSDIILYLNGSGTPKLTANKIGNGWFNGGSLGTPVFGHTNPAIKEFKVAKSSATSTKPNEKVFRFVIDFSGISGVSFGFGEGTGKIGYESTLYSSINATYDANGNTTAWSGNNIAQYYCYDMPVMNLPYSLCYDNIFDLNFDNLSAGELSTQPYDPRFQITASSAVNKALIINSNPTATPLHQQHGSPASIWGGYGFGVFGPSYYNYNVTTNGYTSAYGVFNTKNIQNVLALSDGKSPASAIQTGGTLTIASAKYPFQFSGVDIINSKFGGTYRGKKNGNVIFSLPIPVLGDSRANTGPKTIYGADSVYRVYGPNGVPPLIDTLEFIFNKDNNGYNANIAIDNIRTCQSVPTDCLGVPLGTAQVDQCGVCNGNNACLDCKGVPNGGNTYDKDHVCCLPGERDECGYCYGDGKDDCGYCKDQPLYNQPKSECGVCPGLPNYNKIVRDINDLCCDENHLDDCGVCDGGNQDKGCDNICFSGKVDDVCGVCGGKTTDASKCEPEKPCDEKIVDGKNLDGNGFDQKKQLQKINRKITRLIKRNNIKGQEATRLKKSIKDTAAIGEAIYVTKWNLSWKEIAGKYILCAKPKSCGTVSNLEIKTSYAAATNDFAAIIDDQIDNFKKAGGAEAKAKRMGDKNAALVKAGIKLLEVVPDKSSNCK